MLICGGDGDAKSVVAGLAEQLGFEVIDAGPLSAAGMLEGLAKLWVHLAYQVIGNRNIAFKLLRR
jgi:predicted dinucleotide-binding enzyme